MILHETDIASTVYNINSPKASMVTRSIRNTAWTSPGLARAEMTAGFATCAPSPSCRIASDARMAVTGTRAETACCNTATRATGARLPPAQPPLTSMALFVPTMPALPASTGPAVVARPAALRATSTARYKSIMPGIVFAYNSVRCLLYTSLHSPCRNWLLDFCLVRE